MAYSGGPDSTGLLHLLARLSVASDVRISAAHFDHGIGIHSADVADRCARTCALIGVPFHCGRSARPLAARHAELREARYRFLTETARNVSADWIVTGHQADDQAETVLMRILRGTGPRGLAGIPARRGPIVRPLLGIRRATIIAWLDREGIGYESDPANRDVRWARSRVRHRLIPSLADALGRDPVPLLLEIAAEAAEVDRLLTRAGSGLLDRSRMAVAETAGSRGPNDRVARTAQAFCLATWRLASSLEQAEALRVWARRRGILLPRGGTRSAVEFISRGRSGGRVEPTHGFRVSRSFDTLILTTGAGGVFDTATGCDAELPVHQGSGQARLSIAGRSLQVRWAPRSASPDAAKSDLPPRTERVALAVGGQHYPLLLRSWRPGDRVRTPAGTRKLKKLFGERAVPRFERARLPVLVDRRGRVLWVPGLVTASWAQMESNGPELVIEIADD
ncbi:MAG: tRNA lysidine(34) synthetase TilS [Gemmatimonadota bacterium]